MSTFLKNQIEKFLTGIQAPQCVRCHSCHVRNFYLCHRCEQFIDQQYLDPKVSTLTCGLTVQSLYEWRPGKSDSLSEIALLLKSSFSKYSWETAAKKMVDVDSRKYSNHFFIPIPGHKIQSRHAQYFSDALSKRSGGISCLLFSALHRELPHKTLVKQQRLTKSERLHSDVKIDVDFTELDGLPETAFITLVDDIITTGQTLEKAASVLRRLRPRASISGIVLFNRTLKT